MRNNKNRLLAGLALMVVMVFYLVPLTVATAGSLPDTGQTKCYDANGNEINPCPSPGQSFYGQDAQYPCNPHSYTMLAGGIMVKDNVTGLIWENKTDDNSIHDKDNTYNWYNAQDVFIATLNSQNFGGFSDWRLPTIKELTSIVDRDRYNPSINTAFSPNTVSFYYWSSTTRADSPSLAWVVYFYYGYVDAGHKSYYDFYVRAVRGGQCGSFGNYIDNVNGTVTDIDTGLMWQQDTAPGTYTWQQALAYCENLTFAGYNDWRLPNVNELLFLVDYSRYYLAIDPVFSVIVSSYYWSSTTNVDDSESAWLVEFFYGYVFVTDKSYYSLYVRAVRVYDSDIDGIPDDGDNSGTPGDNPCTGGETENCDDNCPNHPNGTLGTCVKLRAGMVGSYRVGGQFITCTDNAACQVTGGTCQMEQGDCNNNNCGDVCECYADYAVDGYVDGDDLGQLKRDYGDPCPCLADGNGDGFVDGDDLMLLKNEYGRADCPACE